MARDTRKSISKDEMLARVVEPIRSAMEQGKLLWIRPWNQGEGCGLPYNPLRKAVDGKGQGFDGGVNNLLLMIAAMENNWSDPRWMGRGQIKAGGFNITGLTGGRSTMIYAPEFGYYKAEDESGQVVTKKYVKGFFEVQVFNAQQIDDESFPKLSTSDKVVDTVTGYERAHAIYNAVDVKVTHGQGLAAYSPVLDQIIMPNESAFASVDEYHSTRLHETGHATGHESRMNRDKFAPFGTPVYAEEELTAELFAAFACADAGIVKSDLTKNHAAYLQSWHKRLGDQPQVFLDAVNDAWKALAWVRERMT